MRTVVISKPVWMGNFFGGGTVTSYEETEGGKWRKSHSLYRGGIWDDSRDEYVDVPNWPFASFQAATGLVDAPEGVTKVTIREGREEMDFLLHLGTDHERFVTYVPPKVRESRKTFATQQRLLLETEEGLQFSPGAARRIFRAAGPGLAVKAARWSVAWLDQVTKGREEDHNALYAARGLVLAVLSGLNGRTMPAHRVHTILRDAGAPEGFPQESYGALERFLKAAEVAALGYFGRGKVISIIQGDIRSAVEYPPGHIPVL